MSRSGHRDPACIDRYSYVQFDRDIAIPFAVDVRETDKEITIVADTPGLSKEDVKVGTLHVGILCMCAAPHVGVNQAKDRCASVASKLSGIFQFLCFPALRFKHGFELGA